MINKFVGVYEIETKMVNTNSFLTRKTVVRNRLTFHI